MDLPPVRPDTDIDDLEIALDAATHEARLRWVRSLGASAQQTLFRLAEGRVTDVDTLVGEPEQVVRHVGRNALPVFSRFEKRFTRLEGAIVGYNHNPWPVKWVTGPGHFLVYQSPSSASDVWIDYRSLPTRHHPAFPPLRSNEQGLPALVFGNMVDVLRRVSEHVSIGDSLKSIPRDVQQPGLVKLGPVPWLARIGSLLPSASFVLCRVP